MQPSTSMGRRCERALAFALLAIAGAGCAQIERAPEPVAVQPTADWSALAERVMECLSTDQIEEALALTAYLPPVVDAHAGPVDGLRRLHELREIASWFWELGAKDATLKVEFRMEPTIVPHFESRPRA